MGCSCDGDATTGPRPQTALPSLQIQTRRNFHACPSTTTGPRPISCASLTTWARSCARVRPPPPLKPCLATLPPPRPSLPDARRRRRAACRCLTARRSAARTRRGASAARTLPSLALRMAGAARSRTASGTCRKGLVWRRPCWTPVQAAAGARTRACVSHARQCSGCACCQGRRVVRTCEGRKSRQAAARVCAASKRTLAFLLGGGASARSRAQ